MKKFILASTSPRRLELLENLGLIFDAVSPSFDEKLTGQKFSYDEIEKIALNKALSVKKNYKDPVIIISADTVVVDKDKNVLGKPKDRDDAILMLQKLSGEAHDVVTSVAVINTETEKILIESNTTKVFFSCLTLEMIEKYIDTMKPLDKAGAYGIQDVPEGFIPKIEGDFDNVMGLPTKTLIKMITMINN